MAFVLASKPKTKPTAIHRLFGHTSGDNHAIDVARLLSGQRFRSEPHFTCN